MYFYSKIFCNRSVLITGKSLFDIHTYSIQENILAEKKSLFYIRKEGDNWEKISYNNQ